MIFLYLLEGLDLKVYEKIIRMVRIMCMKVWKNYIVLIFIFGIMGNGINWVNYCKVGFMEYYCFGIIVYWLLVVKL